MTTLREAAQQALEALEGGADSWQRVGPAIDALKAALEADDGMYGAKALTNAYENGWNAAKAETVQEPVAWLTPRTLDSYMRPDLGYETCSKTDYAAFPVYTAPPQRKPLTEEEIKRIDDSTHFHESPDWSLRFARAIERAHGIGGQE